MRELLFSTSEIFDIKDLVNLEKELIAQTLYRLEFTKVQFDS